jgi:hypothetical protein
VTDEWGLFGASTPMPCTTLIGMNLVSAISKSRRPLTASPPGPPIRGSRRYRSAARRCCGMTDPFAPRRAGAASAPGRTGRRWCGGRHGLPCRRTRARCVPHSAVAGPPAFSGRYSCRHGSGSGRCTSPARGTARRPGCARRSEAPRSGCRWDCCASVVPRQGLDARGLWGLPPSGVPLAATQVIHRVGHHPQQRHCAWMQAPGGRDWPARFGRLIHGALSP